MHEIYNLAQLGNFYQQLTNEKQYSQEKLNLKLKSLKSTHFSLTIASEVFMSLHEFVFQANLYSILQIGGSKTMQNLQLKKIKVNYSIKSGNGLHHYVKYWSIKI